METNKKDNKIKVHLVFSPSLLYSPYEVLGENMWPPLGILYLASYLRDRIEDVEIKITDGCKRGYQNTLDEIKEFNADIVGISFYTTLAHGASKLSFEVKNLLPDSLIVMGGAHATALPEDTLRTTAADLIVTGEGEETFYKIVKNFTTSKDLSLIKGIDGIAFADKNKFIKNKPAKFITPLENIPFPAWDLIDPKEYKGWYLSKQQPEAIMFFSRGCPFNCTFCSNCVWKSSSPSVRFRDPKVVVDEIEYLNKSFGVKEIFDNSDELNNNIEHALKVCRKIKKRNLGITWKTQLRVSPFTDELAREMKESGCWYVHLGIESGNQVAIDGIEKKIKLEDVENTCRILKKYDIKVLALFMLYNVWEAEGKLQYEDTKMTMKTLDFAWNLVKKGLVDYIGWSIATPYPGSQLYEIAKRHGIVNKRFSEDWESWQKEGLFVMDIPGVTESERKRVKLKGELLRIRCMLLKKSFKLKDLPFLLKRALHIFKHLIK